MSQFLPESAEFKLPGGPVSDADLQFVSRAFGNPNLIAQVAPQFLSYIVSYIEQAGLLIPVSQVPGFNNFTAQTHRVETEQSTASTSYTDLSTVGPTLTGLPDGKYVFFYGCYASNGSAASSRISLKVNSTEAVDADAAVAVSSTAVSIATAVVKDLDNNGVNTVTCRYRAGSGTSSFGTRWLIALRYSNL